MRDVVHSTLSNWDTPIYRWLDDESREMRPEYEPGLLWFWAHGASLEGIMSGHHDNIVIVQQALGIFWGWDNRYETKTEFRTRTREAADLYLDRIEQAQPAEQQKKARRGGEVPHHHYRWLAIRQCYGLNDVETARIVHIGGEWPDDQGSSTVRKAVKPLATALGLPEPKKLQPFDPERVHVGRKTTADEA